MVGDLHIHTRYSDGSYLVGEALAEAALRGLDYISFVDHDTVDQSEAAFAELKGMKATGCQGLPGLVSGVEISAYDAERHRKVHILGYGYDEKAAAIRQLCDPIIRRRHENTLRQIKILANEGYPVSEEEVRKIAAGKDGSGRWLYKQHIMLVLLAAGRADEIYGITYQWLFKGDGPCAGDIDYVDARLAVEAVRADGGLPVLAHPGQTDSWDFIPALVDAGLAGIELYHEDHDKDSFRRSRQAAADFGLFLSGGSDDHGDWGSNHRMGDIRAPFGTLQEMRHRGASRLPGPIYN
ncbi:MAG: PHP domain-containing protein [Spirochaetaceae bacterium]|nr:PHP domain-containing protein [Spirochaetaceae bacterium]MDT8296913.1 PHP domain-containing protein [Spirochaetaceae bacterium]